MVARTFIEIGPWVGLSTTAIAIGLRASKEQTDFITCDRGPTPENCRLVEGGVGMFLPNSEDNTGTCTCEFHENQIRPLLQSRGGQIARLRQNLPRCGVEMLVQIRIRAIRHSSARLLWNDQRMSGVEISDERADVFDLWDRPGSTSR